jgi:hypothetical protein
VATGDDPFNPGGHKVVDAIWNFGYRDEIRRLATSALNTARVQPSRSVRVQHLISNEGIWNDWNQAFDPGYADMACSVDYITSHDVADGPRLMNVILGPMLQAAGLADGGVQDVRSAVDGADTSSNPTLQATVQAALRRVFGAFAILMTSVGMPMWLAPLILEKIPTCYVAVTKDGQLVYMNWAVLSTDWKRFSPYFAGSLHRELASDECVFEFAYTFEAFRGLGVMGAALAEIIGQLVKEHPQLKWGYTYVLDDNVASLKGCRNAGFRPYMERKEHWRAMNMRQEFFALNSRSRFSFEASSERTDAAPGRILRD